MKGIRASRRLVQILSVAALVAAPLANKKGFTAVTGSLYSLAVGPVWITDPLGGLQVMLLTLSADKALLASMIVPVVLALVLGRVFCSWVCPQNTLSEFFDAIADRLGFSSSDARRRLFMRRKTGRYVRYGSLAALLGAALFFGFPAANLFSAPGVISTQITKIIYEKAAGPELGLIAAIIAIEVFFIRRLWCNYLCPVGGLLGLFRTSKTMKVECREDETRVCGGCLDCSRVCGLGLNPVKGEIHPFCHNCGDCIDKCSSLRGSAKPLGYRF